MKNLRLNSGRTGSWSTHTLLPALLLLCLLFPALLHAEELFPLYPCIRSNVHFWEEVYSNYSTRQGILHDSDNLSRVYSVVALEDRQTPFAAQINRQRIDEAKDRLSSLLTDLAAGKRPESSEERRIAALFAGQPADVLRAAATTIRVQVGQSDRFYAGLLRSGRYLEEFRRHFVAQGLPAELAYLPHVESSFNPKAYSKAGAAGLWQFTRSTGRDYLTINTLVDERYDPYLATQAASRLLKENYAALKSWPLALTAYNYGRAGMLRAVKEHGSYERIFQSYDQGYFKFAARNFYSEFLAAKRVAERMANRRELPLERPVATVTHTLSEEVPIDRLRARFGLSAEQFSLLNPALQDPVLTGRHPVPRGYRVRLPADRQVTAKLAHPAVRPALQLPPPTTVRGKTAPSAFRYKVKKGDTRTSIARRFQISPQDLVFANPGNGQSPLRIGEELMIPVRLGAKRD